ncbi:GNAT family N-acetyltransferase [bacterium]|nr:GNAT family N-acetyltransferase [bacterium]
MNKSLLNTMIKKISPNTTFSEEQVIEIRDFLYQHLDRFGDDKTSILECIHYARDTTSKGGYIYVSIENQKIKGVSIVLKTNMQGFIPPYILVYIAVDKNFRGQGIGKKLIQYIQNDLGEAIALHVEQDNPAFHLYEKLGFKNKYLEMRWFPDGSS